MSIKDERIVYSSRLKYFKSLANSQNVIEKLDHIYLFIYLFCFSKLIRYKSLQSVSCAVELIVLHFF